MMEVGNEHNGWRILQVRYALAFGIISAILVQKVKHCWS
jgi:hypothetical protein